MQYLSQRILFLIIALSLVGIIVYPLSVSAGLGSLVENIRNQPITDQTLTEYERDYLTTYDRLDMKTAGFEPKGKLQKVVDSGLDIHKDTPDHDNFVKIFGKYLGGGTCLGMCEIVKNCHERVNFTKGSGGLSSADLVKMITGIPTTIEGYENLREMTQNEEERIKKAMDIAHLDNFRPESWLPVIVDKTVGISDASTFRKLVNRIRFGRTAKISFGGAMPKKEYNVGPVSVNLPDVGSVKGHALLAYKIMIFEDQSLVLLYDPNNAYKFDHSNSNTCLLYNNEEASLSLFPASYSRRYEWAVSINCIDGLVGPWKEQLKEMMSGVVDNVKERVGNGIETIRSGGERIIDSAVNAGRNLADNFTTGVKTVSGWVSSLF